MGSTVMTVATMTDETLAALIQHEMDNLKLAADYMAKGETDLALDRFNWVEIGLGYVRWELKERTK